MSETPSTVRNPYPGLRAFEREETNVFFGRQSELEEVLRRLDSEQFLAITGPPGSGKSSLARAGLIPAFGEETPGDVKRIVLLRPGAGVMERLARELARVFPSDNILESEAVRRERISRDLRTGSAVFVDTVKDAVRSNGQGCLVFVDQFEELFYRGDSEENAELVKLLLEISRDDLAPITVVVALSTDFLSDCTRFAGLAEAVKRGLYLLSAPGAIQLREMVEGPARVAGGAIASEVVDRIVRDIETEPEPLSSLQYVLHRNWKAGDSFDISEYEAGGGVANAISRAGEQVMGELSEEHRGVARKVFQCITYKVPDHRGVAWPTRLEEVVRITGAPEAAVRQVADRFRASTPGFVQPAISEPLGLDSLLAISHDCLIRKWPTLRNWIDEEHDAANLYRALLRSAELHALGRSGLWSGPMLRLAWDRVERKEWSAEWAERLEGNYYAAISFLEESVRVGEAATTPGGGTKPQRRARVFSGLLGLLLIASLGVGLYLYEWQRSAIAEREQALQALAEARQQSSTANQGLSQADLEKGEANRQRNAALRQKEIAERQQQLAESRLRIAENQQRIAESRNSDRTARDELERQLLYVANMNLADRAFGEGDLVRGQEFLGEYLSAPELGAAGGGDKDVRDFFWYYLWRKNHDEIATLRGHADTVSAVAFAPDGKVLATGSRDGNVTLWDPAERLLQGTLEGSGQPLSSMAFSPDGALVGAVGRNGTLTLWDAGSREVVAAIAADGEDLLAMAFTPDGREIVVGGKNGQVSVWDVKERAKVGSLAGHDRDVYAVAVSADGSTLATGSQDDTVKLWDLKTRTEIGTLEGKGDDVHALAFSPDGNLLATGNKNGTVQLWDVASREELATLGDTGGDVYTVAFSADGSMLAAGGRDGALKLWNVARRRVHRVLKGHGDSVTSVAFAPEGPLLATGSGDNTAKLWRTDAGKGRAILPGKTPVFAVAFEPGGKRLATGTIDDTVRLFDLESRERAAIWKGAGDVLFSVAFSPDGTHLATGSKDGTAKVWNVSTGKEAGVFEGHDAVVFSVAFSPDGKTLATGSWDHTVKLWDVPGGKERAALEGHDDAVFSVAFSPDGNLVATGSKDTTVRLWDASTGQELTRLTGHADAVFPVAFSPDGRMLVTGSRDGAVKLWNVARREELRALKGHGDAVSSAAFSPDGRVLVTGSLDDSVKLWDIETGRELTTLEGHAKDVYSVAFSSDGRLLATGSLDGTVRLWERATEAEVAAQQ